MATPHIHVNRLNFVFVMLLLLWVFGQMGLPVNGVEVNPAGEPPKILKFNFTSQQDSAVNGFVAVTSATLYADARGYGIDFNSVVTAKKLSGSGVHQDGLISNKSFFFSANVPEGNYEVKLFLGPCDTKFTTTVRSESRRLMIENLTTAKGQTATVTFIANVRHNHPFETSKGLRPVKLKEREKPYLRWDNKLTIEITGSHPQISALTITPVTDIKTIYLAGDSTVSDASGYPQGNWGQMLPRFFKPTLAVANHANGGETIRSSLGSHRFDKIFALVKPGDYLLIQYGHNDMKSKKPDALVTYCNDLKALIDQARSAHVTPILITSMERKKGVNKNTLKDYPDAVRRVAQENNVGLIDLNKMSVQLYKALGSDLDEAFVDGSHHSVYGGYQLAKCVIEGIRQVAPELASYVLDDLPRYDCTKPDALETFYILPSATIDLRKPLGR